MKNDLKIRSGERDFATFSIVSAVHAQIKLLSMKIYEALQSTMKTFAIAVSAKI
jgi:hypothetical protein